jgi:Region found in RelA / SpoT proteins
MGYPTLHYSRTDIDKAGVVLTDGTIAEDLLDDALAVISNFRSSHSFPLNTMTMGLRRRSKVISPNCLVAQRVKRLSSISSKLHRFPGLRLSQMQDIGGCRAVLSSVDEVQDVIERFAMSSIRHELARMDDYLAEPKPSGYRGIHLIYKYVSDRKETYNGLKIEIQIRSQLQHAWATAVETVGTFIQQALKSSQGEENWLRFFALIGSAIAQRERGELVPGTPTDPTQLKDELRHYVNLLEVEQHLHTYGTALQTFENDEALVGAHYYLLELDPTEKKVTVVGYKQAQLFDAEDDYLALEKKISEKPGKDAVLVSVESLEALHRAYPNYFLDTNLFIDAVKAAIE